MDTTSNSEGLYSSAYPSMNVPGAAPVCLYIFSQSIPIASSGPRTPRANSEILPGRSSGRAIANLLMYMALVVGEGLWTLIAVKYWPGATILLSDFPQTNFAAYILSVSDVPAG